MKRIIIYCDGAARGNPGPAGAGALLLDANGSVLDEVAKYLGETTNNQAEYQALILAINAAQTLGAESVEIFADSELMVRQIKGIYRVKNDGLKPLFKLIMKKLEGFSEYQITHVPREKNMHADKLANKTIDERL